MVKGVVLVVAVMSGFAADAVAWMNEFESCRCSSGLATKGDTKEEVLQKCGKPAQVQRALGVRSLFLILRGGLYSQVHHVT